jgi:hypothetical protein
MLLCAGESEASIGNIKLPNFVPPQYTSRETRGMSLDFLDTPSQAKFPEGSLNRITKQKKEVTNDLPVKVTTTKKEDTTEESIHHPQSNFRFAWNLIFVIARNLNRVSPCRRWNEV